jgi:hypothetical protein
MRTRELKMNGRITTCLLVIIAVFASRLDANQVGDCVGVFFYRSDAPESRNMLAVIQQAVQDGWAIRTSEVHQERDVATRMRIQTLPTLVLLRGGREIDRVLGMTEIREVQRRMLLASSPDSIRQVGQSASTLPTIRGQSQPAIVPLASNVVPASFTSQGNAVPTAQSLRSDSPSRPMTAPQRSTDPAGATVRIRVDEPTHEAIGTGTIIDTHQGEVLVLTCGHLFRDTQGRTPILVETFFGGMPRTYQATLIDFRADETDIGLISFRADGPVPIARLMDHREMLREGDRVFSWGCDNGAKPSQRDSHITKLNRYLGAPNVEVMGKPVQGRSGGGLFNSKGELIGVCYAADDELNEGLYNAPEVVYQQLMKLGLRRLFESSYSGPDVATSGRVDPPRMRAEPIPLAQVSPTSLAAASAESAIPRRLVVMVEEGGRTEQIEIRNPSPVLMDAINSQRLIR